MADTEIGDVQIPKGAKLYISYASAQRDEAVFEDPDSFDVDRADLNGQLRNSGGGGNFCLGAPLARMETKVALEILLDRLPGLRLAPDARPEVLGEQDGRFPDRPRGRVVVPRRSPRPEPVDSGPPPGDRRGRRERSRGRRDHAGRASRAAAAM